jgi:nickel/cobalt exporter
MTLLLTSAAAIAFVHTVLGPDHYVPFIALSKARDWPFVKTTWITVLCGLGHVLGSVVLGFIGIFAGLALHKLEITESIRGDVAAWLVIAFGLVYGVWGVNRAVRNKPHTHLHAHANGTEHQHLHSHRESHSHVHAADARNITPWILFTIFVFGPCEPLIPLLMYPAATNSVLSVVAVAVLFSVITIATMTALVLMGTFGLSFLPLKPLARFSHAIAGVTILLCGVAMHFGL